MIDFLFKGGPVMVPLILSSVIALGVVLDRIWALRGRNVLPAAVAQALMQVEGDKHVDSLLQLCERHASPLSRVIRQGFMNRQKPRQETLQILQNLGRRETHELERGLVILEIVAGISPLLGLLGTVLGMVHVFDVISVVGVGQASALSKGISEALVTTIAGLVIAIPALAAFNFLTKRVDELVIELERLMTVMVNKLY